MKNVHYFKAGIDMLVDDNIEWLKEEQGMEGMGIYFILLLELRMREGYRYKMERAGSLAKRMGIREEKLQEVIRKYRLFRLEEVDGEEFFSAHYLNEKMEEYDRKTKALSEAGKRGAKARTSRRPKPGLSHPGIREDKIKNIFSPLPSPRERGKGEEEGQSRFEDVDPETGERSYFGMVIPPGTAPRPNGKAVLVNGEWE